MEGRRKIRKYLKKLILEGIHTRKEQETNNICMRILRRFLELSHVDEKMLFFADENGKVDISSVENALLPIGIAATAWYADGWYLFPDEKPYLRKRMLSFMKQYEHVKGQKFQPEQYNGMICPALAEMFNLPSAKYFMAKEKRKGYMLSPDFLEEREELIHIARIEELATGEKQSTKAIQGAEKKVSEMYGYLKKFLDEYEFEGQKLDESQKEKTLGDFLKQRFFNRFIENTDEHVYNSAVIVKGKSVKMSPMYDYDFTLTRKTSDVIPGCGWEGLPNLMILDNGKSDITSFMEQYKNYPGMQEFYKNFLQNFSIEKMEEIIKRNIGVKVDRKEVIGHYEILNNNFAEMKRTYERIYPKIIAEGGER